MLQLTAAVGIIHRGCGCGPCPTVIIAAVGRPALPERARVGREHLDRAGLAVGRRHRRRRRRQPRVELGRDAAAGTTNPR